MSPSIVGSAGGRMMAVENSPRGDTFILILPTKLEAYE